MASACVNNVGISSENFLDCAAVKCTSYGWMRPSISFSCEFPDEEAPIKPPANIAAESSNPDEEKQEDSDPEISGKDFIDFEFRLEDPVKMLPADELFSDGKLVPLHLSTIRRKSVVSAQDSSVLKSEEAPKSRQGNEISSTDPYLFSPKAPSCSIHWKELLGLKKLYQNNNEKQEIHEMASTTSMSTHNQSRRSARRCSVKQFLLRGGSKSGLNSSIDSSLSTLPLLKESDNESPSISSRLSLSSSSPGHHEYDDIPRHSLDSDTPIAVPRNTRQIMKNLPRVREVKHKAAMSPETPTSSARVARSPVRRKTPESTAAIPVRDVSADSPRMISSGKILFHSLERSSSSPSTLNGGPRYKHRGMERSNSAHVVRVTPVLNVPVCTIRGLFSSQQKVKDSAYASKTQQHRSKNRTDGT